MSTTAASGPRESVHFASYVSGAGPLLRNVGRNTMRKLLRGILIFVAGIALGVLATLCVRFVADFGKDIQVQIPSLRVSTEFGKFCSEKDRPPTNAAELAAFAMIEATNELSLDKFSELKFVSISNRTAAVIWRLAPPDEGGGTNTVSWQRY